MSIVQAILLGVLYWIGEANLPFVGLWTVQRPLVCGWIAGIILGDALTGAMVGASINLVYLGFIQPEGPCLPIWHWQEHWGCICHNR